MTANRPDMPYSAPETIASEGREARASRTLSGTLSGTNLVRAGDYNLRTVLQAIRIQPDVTRIEISQQTGLTAPTIANITHRLTEMGLVTVASRRKGVRGHPALKLRVVAEGAFSIGLNIDRDHLTLVTLDLEGVVRSRVSHEIAFAMPDEVIAFVRESLDDLIASGGVERSRILGVGVAIPDDLGRISLAHRPQGYERWNDTAIDQELAALMPWPIHCDNDAAAAALGEAEYGTAFDNPSFFYLLISAGLGGGLVIDRNYHRGAASRSGEIGLMPDPTAASPGAVVQDTVSMSALLERLEKAGVASPSIDHLNDPTPIVADVIETWLADSVRSLTLPLVGLACLIDPDALLIGGRLPAPLIERLASGLSQALSRIALPSRPKIMPAVIAQDAPAIGAAILPFLDQLLPSDAILMQAGRG
ncbi:ROK family transcriptional regulator [Brevundimonas vesicularis]|uniref:ROK family transcriptional regulator n=1 Tax=Brevundimonas vesicularis TaxID=41276 RepID=UPI0038506C8A